MVISQKWPHLRFNGRWQNDCSNQGVKVRTLGRQNERNFAYDRLALATIFGLCFMLVCLIKSNCYSFIYSSLGNRIYSYFYYNSIYLTMNQVFILTWLTVCFVQSLIRYQSIFHFFYGGCGSWAVLKKIGLLIDLLT